MPDITSYFHGYDVDQHELIDRITRLGWQLERLESKPEGYVASLKSTNGLKLQQQGNTPETALANALIYLTKQNQMARMGALQQTWVDKLPQIAKGYAEAPTFDYKAAPSWKALADDNAGRADIIKKVLNVETSAEPVPYPDGFDMAKDIQQGKIKVSTHDLKHPIWTPMQHMDHRLVHSVLGQAPAGGLSNWPGVNQAFAHHAHYLGNLAKQALFTDTIGHRAHQIHYGYSPRKIAHLSEFLHGGHDDDLSDGESIDDTRVPYLPKESSVNTDWESGIEPPFPNAYLIDDPLNYFDLREEGKKLRRPWETWTKMVEDD